MRIQERYNGVISYFSETMPVAETELNYSTPFQLLVAVVLSAQCTDKRVNMVTPSLFAKFPTPQDMALSTSEEIFSYIRSVSYPNAKAENLLALAQRLVAEFNGEVPSTIEELTSLRGVGRKTANVILSIIFDQPAMAVDTHVFRVSERIGLTRGAKNPLQAEEQLTAHFPREILGKAHHWLILHGRYVCTARAPKCDVCGITLYCKTYIKI